MGYVSLIHGVGALISEVGIEAGPEVGALIYVPYVPYVRCMTGFLPLSSVA